MRAVCQKTGAGWYRYEAGSRGATPNPEAARLVEEAARQSGITRPRDFLRAKSIIEKSGTPILGIVLNQVPVRKVNQYYSYYRAYAKADTKA